MTTARFRTTWTVSAIIAMAMGSMARAAEEHPPIPNDIRVESFSVWPEAIELRHRHDYRQILVTGRTSTGEQIDLTRAARLEIDLEIARISPLGRIEPVADGRTALMVTFQDHSQEIPVVASGIEEPYQVDYIRDMQPVMAKMGCSAGTCHGSQKGQNGFKLSLRSYDPVFDHRALTDDLEARRFNRAAPDQSLMLLKMSGGVPHVGGVLAQPGEPYYEIVRAWIARGVPLREDTPRVTKIELYPQDPVLPRQGLQQQMAVLATYEDGTVRDVSSEAFIESGNIEVATADEHGLITVLRRGEAPLLARFEGAYAAATLTVMGDRSGFEWEEIPLEHYIDQLVYEKLRRTKTLPSPLASDVEFLRRIYLDLTGLPPSAETVREFLADSRDSQEKRIELIDQLVGGPEFIDFWSNKWADLLQVNRKFLGEEGAWIFREWIRQAVADNMPYDQFVYNVLTASGSNFDNPPASYYKILREPADIMENTTQLFLAVRFNCNKCHDHPFERWTQGQYYELAAYFAHLGIKEDPASEGRKIGGTAVERPRPLIEVVYDRGKGDVISERTGKPAPARVPYGQEYAAGDSFSRREQLARWVTSPENQYFAKSYVNRLWAYLLGVGLIEPIDDIRAGNPPTNPELLDRLTQEFIDSGFDAQHMIRTICASHTYQHSVETNRWNEDDSINFSHAIARRLPAEVLYDAVHLATGSTTKLPQVPEGFRAVELPDVGVSLPFLEDFGRPARESACECERSTGMMLGPVLKLVNGPTLADAIQDPENEIAHLIGSEKDDEQVVKELFLRILSRFPTPEEIELGMQSLENLEIVEEHARLAESFEAFQKTVDERQAAWETRHRPISWEPLEIVGADTETETSLQLLRDGSLKANGPHGKDVYTVVATTNLTGITGFRLEALPDEGLPSGGPGLAPNGNFVLSKFAVQAAGHKESDEFADVKLINASADFSQNGYAASGALDSNDASGWAIQPQTGKPHAWMCEAETDLRSADGIRLRFRLTQRYADGKHALGRFRLSVTTSPRPIQMQSLPEDVVAALAVPPAARSPDQARRVRDYHRQQDTRLVKFRDQLQLVAEQAENRRLSGAQDLAWALLNSPAFLFNH